MYDKNTINNINIHISNKYLLLYLLLTFELLWDFVIKAENSHD